MSIRVQRGKYRFSVERIPNRKRPCLLVEKGDKWIKLASFDGDIQADFFCDYLEKMLESEVGE